MSVIIQGPWTKTPDLKSGSNLDSLRRQISILEDAVGVAQSRLQRMKVLLGMADEDWHDEIPE